MTHTPTPTPTPSTPAPTPPVAAPAPAAGTSAGHDGAGGSGGFLARCDRLLAAAVQTVTGNPHAQPRPGQQALMRDIAATLTPDTPDSGDNPDSPDDGADARRRQWAGQAPTGLGKALDVATPIPTPTGWKRIGDLFPGDELFDENGDVCRVTNAFATMHNRPCYEVVFDDGSSVVADADHLWTTSTREQRRALYERRRSGIRFKGSRRRLERYQFFSQIAHEIENDDCVHTRNTAASLLDGWIDAEELGIFRRSIGFSRLAREEQFDLRPVVAALAEHCYETSGMAKPAPECASTRTTEDIRGTLRGQGGGRNHALPKNHALSLPETLLPIDPYVLGAWLGDGDSNGSGFTSADQEILDEIDRRGYYVKNLTAKYKYSIYTNPKMVSDRWHDSFTTRLRDLGVHCNKHIPMMYLRASREQRIDLLRGLVDTDGTVASSTGAVEISLCNERLSRDVTELVRSLGIKTRLRFAAATVTERGHRRAAGTRWRITFTTNAVVATILRKRGRLPSGPVRVTVGTRYVDDVRPVATRPVRCIAVDSPSHLFLAGESMVATHNSLAELVPAVLAAGHGMRTVISTETLALQNQIVSHDAPAVTSAAERLFGLSVPVAVHKGFRNTACQKAAHDLAADTSLFDTSDNSGDGSDGGRAQKLADWVANTDAAGRLADRNDCPDPELWHRISIDAADCVGASCPFADVCSPRRARKHAGQASIIVCNHALLGIQAAHGIPVIVDSTTLGPVHAIIADECHALPGIVRNQGGHQVSGRRLARLADRTATLLDQTGGGGRQLADTGRHLAGRIDTELADQAGQVNTGTTPARLADGHDPLAGCGDQVETWLTTAARTVTGAAKHVADDAPAGLKLVRHRNRITGLANAVDTIRWHNPLYARWLDPDTSGDSDPATAAHAAPVHTAPMLAANLWTAAPDPDPDTGDTDGVRRRLNVVCLSATVPAGFAADAGLTGDTRTYPNPFADAYRQSAAYTPTATGDELAQITRPGGTGKRARFDLSGHPGFAAGHMATLANMCPGGVLILSATARAGRGYTSQLRAALPGRHVWSQWDDRPLPATIAAWKHDPTAVLVGTRSLMTGLDAPGNTCQLVIVDRIPRAAPNPVDDARAAALTNQGVNPWVADQHVYGADAALLLAQACGRLIRADTDTGMVAVLDPRLAAGSPISYPTPTRTMFDQPLEPFGTRLDSLDAAVGYLTRHQHQQQTAA